MIVIEQVEKEIIGNQNQLFSCESEFSDYQ